MTQDSLQIYRSLVASAAALLSIDLAEEEIVDPVAFNFEDMEVMLSLDGRGDDDAVIFSAPFGLVPADRELALYREFLDANLFWSGTNAATIGVDSDTREAVLCLRAPLAGLCAEQIAATAAEMIETALIWKQAIAPKEENGGALSDPTAIRV